MIKLIESKDIETLCSKIDELNERTKNHTKQIKELEQKIKENKE